MNSGEVKALSAFLTVILISGGGLAPVVSLAANLPVGDAASIPANHALLRQAMGTVMRAEKVDESKQALGEALPAKVNDLLPEGSVIATGARSFAELKWTSVTSRIWQNTVVQIRPSKRSVYLQQGGLVFNLKKDRPDKAPYDIRTKVLQARIHGTTVQVIALKNVEKISVLEGNIDVRNLQNGSVVHLTPGVVYEVQVRGVIKTDLPNFKLLPEKSEASGNPNISECPDIRLNPSKGELIFQDSHTRALAYTVSAKAVLEHPLIGGANRIPSYDLIDEAMSKLPEGSAEANKLDRTIARNFKINRLPRLAYAIGPNVGNGIAMPEIAMGDVGPSAKIENVQSDKIAVQAPKIAPTVQMPVFHLPESPAEEFDTTSFFSQSHEAVSGQSTPVFSNPIAHLHPEAGHGYRAGAFMVPSQAVSTTSLSADKREPESVDQNDSGSRN